VIPSLLIVIVAVVVLLYNDFGLLAGVAITFGCLALNQIAYLIGAAISILGSNLRTFYPVTHRTIIRTIIAY
jgi:hypothetical protein